MDRPKDSAVAAVAAELAAGTIVGSYEILSLTGSGATSAVYKSRQMVTERIVALKILHRHLLGNEEAMRRFQLEAKAVSNLDHRAIVKAIAFGVSEDGRG